MHFRVTHLIIYSAAILVLPVVHATPVPSSDMSSVLNRRGRGSDHPQVELYCRLVLYDLLYAYAACRLPLPRGVVTARMEFTQKPSMLHVLPRVVATNAALQARNPSMNKVKRLILPPLTTRVLSVQPLHRTLAAATPLTVDLRYIQQPILP